MKNRIMTEMLVFVLLAASAEYAAGNSIRNVRFSPASPAQLKHGQEVNITFDYYVAGNESVRIFARPMTRGKRTPNYAASPSPLYPAGNGRGKGMFTIQSGEVTVDQVRFQVFSANDRRLIAEKFFPVRYRFSRFAVVSEAGHSISNVRVYPGTQARMAFGRRVQVAFDYSTVERQGVRIFARPLTGGNLTPNYAASGSTLYPAGKGTGTGYFTISRGDVTIDQIRFQMYTADQRTLLYEYRFPVKYEYSASGGRSGRFVGPLKRSVLPGGAIRIGSGNRTFLRIAPDGEKTYEGEGTSPIRMRMRIPATPPPPSAGMPNEEWMTRMDAWLADVANVLMERIEYLVQDKESIENYREREDRRCSTLYERVDFRLKFLAKLIEEP